MTETEPDGNDDDKVQAFSPFEFELVMNSALLKKLILQLGGCICTSQVNNRFF
jgi:hypothetical protein